MKVLNKIISVAVAFAAVSGYAAYGASAAEDEQAGQVVILYTNDVHNAYEKSDSAIGYASLAAYKKQLEAQGAEVVLVDAGDAVQGGYIGTLSKGDYIRSIMDELDYSIAVPGNHEFDYGMENFLELADKAQYEYICCNFTDLKTGETVCEPYKIIESGGLKIGYVGIITPETLTSSTPAYFMEGDEYVYDFCGGDDGEELYAVVQNAVDKAREQGADYIVAVAHTGVDVSSSPWTSQEIISNTSGIDAYIDGHSHSVIEGSTYENEEGEAVILTSTGDHLMNFGEMTITTDGITTRLVADYTEQDEETLEFIGSINEQFEKLINTVVADSDVLLTTCDPETGERLVRSQSTNLGDLCADAYLAATEADVAIVNGGGIRTDILQGDITYGNIINVFPFGNTVCMVKASGQQILDALEMGARYAGVGESGGFLHVSGLTYEINLSVPSSVKTDENGMFTGVDGEYRVCNVMIGGEPLEADKLYTLASHNYYLKNKGDGFTMFEGCEMLLDEIIIDNEALIKYITEDLGGSITADSIYADPYGSGRIKVVTGVEEPTCTENGRVNYLRGKQTVYYEIPAVGHSLSQWGVTAEPSDGREGEERRSCDHCDYEEIRKIPAEDEPLVGGSSGNIPEADDTQPDDDAQSDSEKNPATGVSHSFAALFAAGSAVAAALAVKKSRRR